MAWRVSALTNVQLGLQLQLPLPPPVVTTQAMCGQHSSGLRDAREAIKSLSLLDSAGTQRCPHSPPEGGQCPPLAMRGGAGKWHGQSAMSGPASPSPTPPPPWTPLPRPLSRAWPQGAAAEGQTQSRRTRTTSAQSWDRPSKPGLTAQHDSQRLSVPGHPPGGGTSTELSPE